MGQSNIKDAVSKNFDDDGLEPSVMGDSAGGLSRPQGQQYHPQAQEMTDNQQEYYQPQQSSQENYNNYGGGQEGYPQDYLPSQEEYYPQEGYGYDNYASGGYDTDSMIEIAEQVFAEKIRKLQKQIEELEKFKVTAETKVNSSEERLKRIESSMDKLQMAILEKVGSYGSGLDSIKKEMSMMQNSFSKVLPSLVEHKKHPTHHNQNDSQTHHSAHPKHSEHQTHKRTTSKKKK